MRLEQVLDPQSAGPLCGGLLSGLRGSYSLDLISFITSYESCILCQVIPFPPEDTGMIFQPDPANPITLVSDYTVYNPKLPLKMAFPDDFCGDNGNIMMIVGIVPRVTLIDES